VSRRRTPVALAAAAALAAGALDRPARADDDTVWAEASADPEAAAVRAKYERELEAGNEDVQLAAGADWRDKRRHIVHAVQAYRNATIAMPDGAEAHYRLAVTEFTYFLGCVRATPLCDPDNLDRDVMRDVVEHLDAFTRLAPLDPRGTELLFERAILRTKLTTKPDLEAAIVDYETFLDRIVDGETATELSGILGNLAETYMMVGRIEEAIGAYEQAAAMGGDVSTSYGLAVALDRDGQGTRARQILAGLKLTGYESFQHKVLSGQTFFVPEGEVNYYYALAEEALGLTQQALVHWELFIRSKAYPAFEARAKHNRDALKARLNKWRK
jgi:tetratricopeptide (TPR) repeat protein